MRLLDFHRGWILFLLLVVGLLVRTPRLFESLWYDEIAAWRDYGVRGPKFIVTTFYDPANHIAHTLATWWSGTTLAEWLGVELALRVPALLFSLLTIVVMWNLGRRVFKENKEFGGAVCGLLAAVLPVMVLEGVESRGYSMMICASAAATYCFLRVLDDSKTTRTKMVAAYAIVVALGAWAHMMTVFVAVGHSAWLIWQGVKGKTRQFGAFAITMAAVLTLLLYAPVLEQIFALRGSLTATTGDQPGLFGAEGLHLLMQLGGTWSWWTAPGLAMFILGVVAAMRNQKWRPAIVLALLGLPMFILAVSVMDVWVYARFALFVTPGVILSTTAGVVSISRRSNALGLFALLLVVASGAVDLLTRPPKQPLRDAALYVQAQQVEQEPVVVIGLLHNVLDVYKGDLNLHFTKRHGADLTQQLDAHEPLWIVMLYPRHVSEDKKELLRNRGFALDQRFDGWADWGGGDVLVYRRN